MNKLKTGRTLKNFKKSKRIILTKIATVTVNYFQNEVFDSEGGSIGNRWKKSKRAIKDGGKTLTDTGAGKRSIRKRIKSSNLAIIQAEKKYMNKHQKGLKGMPVRKFFGNSKELTRRCNNVITKEMKKI
jgi:hypothetical protein